MPRHARARPPDSKGVSRKGKESASPAAAPKTPPARSIRVALAALSPAAATPCPGCGESVPLSRMGFHIDEQCGSAVKRARTPRARKGDDDSGDDGPADAPCAALPDVPYAALFAVLRAAGRALCASDGVSGGFESIPRPVTGGTPSPRARRPYYQRTFNAVVGFAMRSPALFGDGQADMIARFWALPENAQRLYIRLFQRVPTWFRVDRLEYPELGDIAASAVQLAAAGFVADGNGSAMTLETAVGLLSAAELASTCARFNVHSRGTKPQLAERLQSYARTQMCVGGSTSEARVAAAARSLLGRCVRITDASRAAFGRAWTLCLLEPLDEDRTRAHTSLFAVGRTRYARYDLSLVAPFGCVADVAAYEAAVAREQQMTADFEGGRFAACAPHCEWALAQLAIYTRAPPRHAPCECRRTEGVDCGVLERYSAGWVVCRMACLGVDVFDRCSDHARANDILRTLLAQRRYVQDRRGRWWDRLALNLDRHIRDPAAALSACIAGLADSHVRTGHMLALHERARRLARRHPALALAVPDAIPPCPLRQARVRVVAARRIPNDVRAMYAGASGGVVDVEELALERYREEGWRGVHAESAVGTSLFATLLWDVLFTAREGAFLTPFQVAPLDLFTDCFYSHRRRAIDARIAAIRAMDGEALRTEILRVWEVHGRAGCVGMAWDTFDADTLGAVACGLGAHCVAGICEALAGDFRHCAGGMPDLCLWRTEPSTGVVQARFVEVKSEKDRLSPKQRVWLDRLAWLGADVEVCRVLEPPDVPGGVAVA